MKAKSYLKYVMAAGLLVSLSSCVKDEYLNPVNDTALPDDIVFDTRDRINNQVSGIYTSLKVGNMYGSRVLIYNDVKAENFLSNDPNRVTARAAWEWSELSGDNEVNNLWGAAYTTINRINLFLEGMTLQGDTVAKAEALKFRAEARFSRAVAYYTLLQFYARPYWDGNGSKPGVPLRLVGISKVGSNNIARSSVAEVYAQILEDLNFAEANLPLTNANAVLNTTRAHRNTAIAMKVRTYMSMQKYPEAITEANKIVSPNAPFTATSGVAHALAPNIAAVFTNYTTTESIFSFPFTTTDAPAGQSQLGGYYMPLNVGGASGIFYLNPAGVIADSSWKTATDRRRSFVLLNSGKYWLSKYAAPGPFLDWAPFLRYSDILLLLAEATVRTTGTVDARAVALLNAVRNRSDAATTFTVASFASADALIAAILQERNIEFLGEGIRSLDIQRLALAYPGKSMAGVTVQSIPTTSPVYIWPTPSEESRYNSLID